MTLVEDPEWVAEALATAARRRFDGDLVVVADRFRVRFERLIREQRNWLAEMAELVGDVDRSQAYVVDGHRAVTGWCRALSQCSVGQASRWRRLARLCAAVPQVADALADGQIGVDHVQELARVYANPRVRGYLPEYIDALLADARRSSFEAFRSIVLQWEQLLDDDGPEPAGERAHRNRSARIDTDGSTTRLAATWGNTDGAEIDEILAHYRDAEWRTDCDAARQRWGEDGYLGHLPRTAAQRSADALHRLFLDAARSTAGGPLPDPLLNVTVDIATFEQILADLADDVGADDDERSGDDESGDDESDGADDDERDGTGDDDERDGLIDGDESSYERSGDDESGDDDESDGTGDGDGVSSSHDVRPVDTHDAAQPPPARTRPRRPPPRPPAPIRRLARPPDPRWWRQTSQHGAPLPRRAVIEAMLLGHTRRIITDAAGIAVDVGRRRRLFTGIQRDMIMRLAHWCTHPGCTVPARHCQADHTLDHQHGGHTTTTNGGPRCPHHNRLKNHGYTVWLDPTGYWHTYRPDGTEIG